jgi:hypothetical protein
MPLSAVQGGSSSRIFIIFSGIYLCEKVPKEASEKFFRSIHKPVDAARCQRWGKNTVEETANGSSLDGANGEIVCVYFSREQTSVKILPPLYRSPKEFGAWRGRRGREEEQERKTGKLFALFFYYFANCFSLTSAIQLI